MPRVGAGTVRNQFAVGEDFVPAMRTRTSWVFGPLHLLDPASLTIIQSGVSWVLKMTTPAAVPGYLIAIEVEEKWPIEVAAEDRHGPGAVRERPIDQGLLSSDGYRYVGCLRLGIFIRPVGDDGEGRQRLG